MLEPIIGKIEVPEGKPTVKECLDRLQEKHIEEQAAAKAAAAKIKRWL
jgi:hypothetical protein